MWGDVTKNICEYMNSKYEKQFNHFEVSIIQQSIEEEREDRRIRKIEIRQRTKNGQLLINQRVAEIVNKKLSKKKVTSNDIKRFKECRRCEFEYRTGRCCWGIPNVRQKRGFDPDTGLEIIE